MNVLYQSFDQEMCIQTNLVILQLHIQSYTQHIICEKQYICGLVTHQFRISKKKNMYLVFPCNIISIYFLLQKQ